MARKSKMGRPRLPEGEKGRVYTFYAPKDLSDNLESVLENTGGTISEFLREAVENATAAQLEMYARSRLSNPILNQYTGGSIETPKRK